MPQVLTAKLKLELTQEQKQQLRVTSLAYRDALNYTSGVAFEMGKADNGTKIQKEVYYTLRERFKLPAQMACNVPRQVGATYKSSKIWVETPSNERRLYIIIEIDTLTSFGG